MSIEKYFEREYNYLQRAGEEFAEKHQAIAGKLRLTERQRKDPFVERLMEAFAFLAGRIHERLDDEIPEFTGGLLEQLFPQFLRPFPSCAILEAQFMTGAITQPIFVKKGSEVQTPTGRYKVKYRVSSGPQEVSRVVEKTEPAEFIFRTTQDLIVRPLKLKTVRLETLSKGNSALILQIQPERNTKVEDLDLKKLQIYIQGAESLKYTLLMFLIKHVKEIQVRELTNSEAEFRKMVTSTITMPALNESDSEGVSEGMLPYARQSFKGFRILQEYFAFPERFFFLDIEGIDTFPASDQGLPIEIRIIFDRRFPTEYQISVKNILLHCTPIINLFDRPTEEVPVNQRMPEYYIVPDIDRRKSREIYAVKKVIGVGENRMEQYSYIPITSYDILDTYDPEYEFKRFYLIQRRAHPMDMGDTHIRLFGPSLEQDIFPKETLSIEAILSNGFLPAKYLEVGSISEPIDFPAGLKVRNLTVPSEVLPNPERQNFLWSLISHLSLSYQTLAQTDNLKTILSLYNWTPSFNNPNKKRIEGIVKVHSPEVRSIFRKRALVRGIVFKVEVDGKQFEHGDGDIFLFGQVLNRFLSEYVTINSFVILNIVDIETNKEFSWEPKLGKILPV